MADPPRSSRRMDPVINDAYIGSICELQNEKNLLLAHGRVDDINARTVTLRQRDDDIPPALHFGMPIKLNIYNNRLGFKVLTGILAGSHDNLIRLVGMEVVQGNERRSYYRVPMLLNGMLYIIAPLDNLNAVVSAEPQKKEEAPPIKVRMENLSLSGLQFSCYDIFFRGDRFIVKFAPFTETMRLHLEVVRSYKDELDRRHYGCRLLQMYDEDVDRLSKMLIQLQLQQRGKL